MSEIGRQGYGKALIFTGTNGKRYFWKPTSDSCALWMFEDGRWKSAVSVYRLKGADGKETGHTLWTDANGDGLVQEDELSKLKIPTGKWSWIDRDLTLHGQDGSWKPASVDARQMWVLYLLETGRETEAKAEFTKVRALRPANLKQLEAWFAKQIQRLQN